MYMTDLFIYKPVIYIAGYNWYIYIYIYIYVYIYIYIYMYITYSRLQMTYYTQSAQILQKKERSSSLI